MPTITEWFTSNKLHVNVNISTAMPFHPRQTNINTNDNRKFLIILQFISTVPFSISTMFIGIYIGNVGNLGNLHR